MEKEQATLIGNLLRGLGEGDRYSLIRIAERKPLSKFHKWVDGRPLISADLVERSDGARLHVLLIDWREGDWYCVVFPENRSNPYAELRKVIPAGNRSALWWRYRPSKRDGRNAQRMKQFEAEHGSDGLQVRIPRTSAEISMFVDALFALVAARLRADAISAVSAPSRLQTPEELPPDVYVEGAATRVTVNAFERNTAARRACIRYWGAVCVVCGFDASVRYGPEFKDLIHVHHLVPLSAVRSSREVDPVRDMRPVCPTCHAVIHRNEPPFTPEQVQKMLRSRADAS